MKSFVISLSKVDSSINSAIMVNEKLLEYGFDSVLFEGTYGDEAMRMFKKERRRPATYGIKTDDGIVRKEWSLKEAKKVLRPGVLGCFYSHYRLWQKCVELNEPVFIFEDDVIFERGYEPVVWQDVLLLCTGKMAHKHRVYGKMLYAPEGNPSTIPLRNTSMPGAVGYGITPQGARKLVEAYKIEMLPADTAMNGFVVKLECHTYLMGRAAIEEDGKISLTSSKMWSTRKK